MGSGGVGSGRRRSMPPAVALAVTLQTLLTSGAALAVQEIDPWVETVLAPQYFAVLVVDTARSVEWYRTALGLEVLDSVEADDGSFEIVNLGNQRLLVELIRDRRATEAERPRGFFKVGFAVPDVDRVAQRVEAATGQRPRIVDDAAHGLRILQLKDPDGNTVQLTSPLDE